MHMHLPLTISGVRSEMVNRNYWPSSNWTAVLAFEPTLPLAASTPASQRSKPAENGANRTHWVLYWPKSECLFNNHKTWFLHFVVHTGGCSQPALHHDQRRKQPGSLLLQFRRIAAVLSCFLFNLNISFSISNTTPKSAINTVMFTNHLKVSPLQLNCDFVCKYATFSFV